MSLPALPFLFASERHRDGADRHGGGGDAPARHSRAGAAESANTAANDQRLIDAIRGADELRALDAFELLYKRHADLLIPFAAAIVGERADAGDIVHDVFISIWERRNSWHPDAARGLRNYLYVSVRNSARNRARTERRAEVRAFRAVSVEPQSIPPASERDDDAETLARVWAALDQLPSLRKQVAMLRWGEGMSPQEIADTLDMSRNSVDQHLYRAVQTLRTVVPGRLV